MTGGIAAGSMEALDARREGVGMRRYPVRSSALRTVGYDFGSGTLEVEFASGGVYDYDGVPPEEALQLLEAESLGAYFTEHIRTAYRARRAA